MNLRSFGILVDENVHRDVVAYLRDAGHDVRTVADLGLIGHADIEIIRVSVSQNRIVLTHDSDFGTLAVASEESVVGLVYVRPGHILPSFTVQTLQTLFSQNLEVRPPFLIVAERRGSSVKIRVRQL